MRKPTAKQLAKQLEAEIAGYFNKHGKNIQFNIMDLGKIFNAGKEAANSGGDVEGAVIDAIEKYKIAA